MSGKAATAAELDWCHARLRAGSAGTEDPDDRSTVQAMPIVLHLPRAETPGRTPLLEAAGVAVVALCLDPRVAPGGPWHAAYVAWLDARMRKIARRARGAHWRAAGEVDGVTAEVDGAAARAFVPGPVDDVDPRLSRLQIGGTELARDEPGPPAAGVPVVWIDAALEMSVGKAAAQVGHGVMLLAAAMSRARLGEWVDDGLPLAVREADTDRWAELTSRLSATRSAGGPDEATGNAEAAGPDEAAGRGDPPGLSGVAVAVHDAGFTEVAPGSVTVIATDGA